MQQLHISTKHVNLPCKRALPQLSDEGVYHNSTSVRYDIDFCFNIYLNFGSVYICIPEQYCITGTYLHKFGINWNLEILGFHEKCPL